MAGREGTNWCFVGKVLGLTALLAAVSAAPALSQGGYYKAKADIAKGYAQNSKLEALDRKAFAADRKTYADSLKKLAADGYAARFDSMTDAQKVSFENAMQSGDTSYAAAGPHHTVGEDRLALGEQYFALGDSKYASGDYQGAAAAYDKVSNPEGARQHFDHAWADFNSEYVNYNSAAQNYAIAYSHTNPPQ
jgi:tetratricopeptide (TPR) repeat protein